MAQLKIKLVKSLIGSKKDQIATAQALKESAIVQHNPIIHKLKARWLKSSTSST